MSDLDDAMANAALARAAGAKFLYQVHQIALAAEIERLTGRLADTRAELSSRVKMIRSMDAERDALRAAVKRLLAAQDEMHTIIDRAVVAPDQYQLWHEIRDAYDHAHALLNGAAIQPDEPLEKRRSTNAELRQSKLER